jgi:parallel beta-helix repeat protein
VAQCGQRIERSFVLANDLECAGDALVAAADGIVLDLAGHLLKGPGMGPQTWPAPQLDSVGIRADGRKGITVRNGRITAFSTGVYFLHVSGSVVEDVISTQSRFGLYIHDSDGNTVRRNVVEANVYGLHLQNANDTLVEANQLVRQTYASPGGYGVYLYASERNRLVENTIEDNINWGIWFSEARGNLVFHNNVSGNHPQVSDSSDRNQWFDAGKKEGNFWADHRGADRDGDGIADTPYAILGAGGVVDAYPFMKRDGWKTKTVGTVDHYRPPPSREPRAVRLAAVAGASLVAASATDERATTLVASIAPPRAASAIALGTDGRTVYALDGRSLFSVDLTSGAVSAPIPVTIEALALAANRDGRSVFLIGPRAAEQVDLSSGTRVRFAYDGEPTALAASYKHNQMFVATRDGIDMMYIQTGQTGNDYSRGGHVPYTIPLSGAPVAMTMNAAGTRIYASVAEWGVVHVVDTEQLEVIESFAVGAVVRALAVDPRGSRLYVATPDGVVAVDLAVAREPGGVAVVRRVPLPGRPTDVAVSPNGDEVYVGLGGERLGIAVLRASDLALSHVIDLAAAPVRLLVGYR